jgi:3-methyladenine DNA glycosylase/8-oxoguanine DNA glycosylase
MEHTNFRISGRPDFDFWRTVISHGWYDLAPFACDPVQRSLGRILTTPAGMPVSCLMREAKDGIRVTAESPGTLSAGDRRSVRLQIAACFRLEEDLGPLHARARRLRGWSWIATSRSGRLLRAPTVFEDAVKMICTTNCTWALTRKMVADLVRTFGIAIGDGRHAFPAPSAIAAATEADLRRRCTTGYRSPYILELSRRVTSGELDLEAWRDPEIPEEELYWQMRSVKGIGEYAAGNLLRLAGRYERLGLDSWVRQQFSRLHHGGRKVSDRTIERHYREFGVWRGLFFWLEMTRHWHDDKFPV